MAKSSESNVGLLNEGLLLAMEWGKNWLAPIQARLGWLYPDMSTQQLDEIHESSRVVMKTGLRIVEALSLERAHEGDCPQFEDFKAALLQRHAWVDDENCSRLFSQSMYYLMK